MITQIEKFRGQVKTSSQASYEESNVKYPHYFVDASNTLESQTNRKAFYFFIDEEAVVSYTNDLSNQTIFRTLKEGREYWGEFSDIVVTSGLLLVYAK